MHYCNFSDRTVFSRIMIHAIIILALLSALVATDPDQGSN